MADLQRVTVENLRCIKHLEVPLVHPGSQLPGDWTCLAGINGSGKTTVLQAIALAMVPHVGELGNALLQRMRRSVLEGALDARVSVELSHGAFRSIALRGEGYPDRIPEVVLRSGAAGQFMPYLGYGAHRTVADYDDRRWSHVSRAARRLVNLFDAASQIPSASALLHNVEPDAGWVLFAALLERLPIPLRLVTPDGQPWLDNRPAIKTVQFETVDGVLGPTDLPDGYRSTLAWLADLCLEHAATDPTIEDLEQVRALVLIDEIDLHLHPRLQRELVPSLRAALPQVQWVVSTHSPLVLSCFDRREIVALDREAPSGIRELDRQIMGFSADDVYLWLMDTPPTGNAMGGIIQQRPDEAEVVLTSSPSVSEDEARDAVELRRQRLAKVLGRSS